MKHIKVVNEDTIRISWPYHLDSITIPQKIILTDHLNGFDKDLDNTVLRDLNSFNKNIHVTYHQILSDEITDAFPMLDFHFSSDLQNLMHFRYFFWYNNPPPINFKNFLCSFNGSPHVGRQLLTSIIYKFGLFNPTYSSKNFKCSKNQLGNHFQDMGFTEEEEQFYRMFFSIDNDDFWNTTYSHGYKHTIPNQESAIYNLEDKLIGSFVNLVSETMSTSYCPFVTEKFLFSVVTKGLFLAYGQPGWHSHIEKYYGFKKYNKIFDYRFDDEKNPIKRLVELMTMLYKFSFLSTDDLYDLYLMEKDTIEYNYDHYFSKRYLECMKQND